MEEYFVSCILAQLTTVTRELFKIVRSVPITTHVHLRSVRPRGSSLTTNSKCFVKSITFLSVYFSHAQRILSNIRNIAVYIPVAIKAVQLKHNLQKSDHIVTGTNVILRGARRCRTLAMWTAILKSINFVSIMNVKIQNAQMKLHLTSLEPTALHTAASNRPARKQKRMVLGLENYVSIIMRRN